MKLRPEEPGGIASPFSWVRETPAAENSSEFLRFYKNSPTCTLLRWIMRGRQIRDVEPSYVCLSPRSCMVSEPFLCFAVLFLEVICPLAGGLSVNPVSSRWLSSLQVAGHGPSRAELHASVCLVALELCPLPHCFLAEAVLYQPGWTDTSVLQMSVDF